MQLESSADWWHRGPKLVALSLRFATKVNRDGPCPEWHPEYGNCHLWTASVGSNGYGQIGRGGRNNGAMGAHLAAWQLASGAPVPDGLMVGHTCDVKLCVRNDTPGVYLVNGHEFPRFGHLWLGTLEDNNADMYAKGRAAWQTDSTFAYIPRGEQHGRHILTWAAVADIRQRYALGNIHQATLAEEYDVSQTAISNVVRGISWRLPQT